MVWGLPREPPPFFGRRVYLANPTLEDRPVQISSSATNKSYQLLILLGIALCLPSPAGPSRPGGQLYLGFVSPRLRRPLVQATTAAYDCPYEES